MSLHLETKYISLLSLRLGNLTKKSPSLYNFRCVYCHDSQKNKNKARAYLYERKGAFKYYCHNCGHSTYFYKFLKDVDSSLAADYRIDRMKEEGKIPAEQKQVDNSEAGPSVNIFDSLQTIANLFANHPARQYITNRKIPEKWYKILYYVENFERFSNSLVPDKYKLERVSSRVIIPFINKKNEVVGFTGRAIEQTESTLRFLTVRLDENKPLVFNEKDVDYNRDFYVLEAPIDAMFLDNAIAISGSTLLAQVRKLPCDTKKSIHISDNEPRNKQIVKQVKKSIDAGYKVVVWPTGFSHKDINDLVLAGYDKQQLHEFLKQRTFQGLAALNEFSHWRRI